MEFFQYGGYVLMAFSAGKKSGCSFLDQLETYKGSGVYSIMYRITIDQARSNQSMQNCF